MQKVKNYKHKIEVELTDICEDILKLIEEHLVPNSVTDEAKVFFNKMKADYFRYKAEFAMDAQKQKAAQEALQAYADAAMLAKGSLSNTHPLTLGLALNHSVFYYEIMQNPEKACAMARTAFDEAIQDLDNVQDEFYKDATLIMQLLRDNLLLWTSELIEEDGVQAKY